MASEISISMMMSFSKGNLQDSFQFNMLTPAKFNMNGKNYIRRTQAFDTTGANLGVSGLSTFGLCMMVNRSGTNTIKIKTSSGGSLFCALKPGEPTLFRFDPSVTAPYAQAVGFVITAATNANPVVFTASGHGLVTGDTVVISGFTGNWTPCNGTFTATVVDSNSFSIPVNSSSFGAMTGSPVFLANNNLEFLLLED